MKTTKIHLIILCPGLLLFGGCATTVTRVDPSGPRTLTTANGIDLQDWNDASASMINSLRDNFINTGKLQSPPDRPALLAISRIVNNTGIHIDTDMLVKKIRVDLLRASEGKIVTSTTIGLAGAEDPVADEERRRARLSGIEPNHADYTLSGKIIEQTARSGNVREASFVFQLSITKSPEGFAVWEDERTIAKQAKRPTISF